MPKISQDTIPQRTVLSEPQLAEQLVEAPTDVLVVVPRQPVVQTVDTPIPGRALFIAGDGHEWCRVPTIFFGFDVCSDG